MLDLIKEEGKADQENYDWCKDERKEKNKLLDETKKDIGITDLAIDTLVKTIEHPETGLKKQIADTELALLQNTEAQTEETKTRTEENIAYQKDIKNLVEAEGILKKAIKVRSAYYDDMDEKVKEGYGGA